MNILSSTPLTLSWNVWSLPRLSLLSSLFLKNRVLILSSRGTRNDISLRTRLTRSSVLRRSTPDMVPSRPLVLYPRLDSSGSREDKQSTDPKLYFVSSNIALVLTNVIVDRTLDVTPSA